MTDTQENKDGATGEGETVIVDPIIEKDALIKKLENDLQNYKNVAMKRLGKLPGDADFVAGADEKTGLTVEETVRKALLDNEYARLTAAKDEDVKRIMKENSELKLALKNRPETSIGGDNTSTVETKDNVFSPEQIAELTRRATRLKVDPEKFIENAKKNLQRK